MPYFDQSDIAAELPPEFLTEALDDNADGTEDTGLWDVIVSSASEKVDALLGQRYNVPFTGAIPAIVKQSAIVFALETLYRRRGYGTEETNPWITLADGVRKQLSRIGNGMEPLTPETKEAKPSISIISETSRTTSRLGNLSS